MNQTNNISPNFKLTPLQLLNLYLTDGTSTGPKESKLYQKFNTDLTWDTMLNEGYQSDLAPLLYHIITKTNVLNKINQTNQTSKINEINKINQTNNTPFNQYQVNNEVITKLKQMYQMKL